MRRVIKPHFAGAWIKIRYRINPKNDDVCPCINNVIIPDYDTLLALCYCSTFYNVTHDTIADRLYNPNVNIVFYRNGRRLLIVTLSQTTSFRLFQTKRG